MLQHRGAVQNTLSGDLEQKLNWRVTVYLCSESPSHPQCHAICTPRLCTGGENTVRETQRVPRLTETDSSNPLILFDVSYLPAKPEVLPIHA